MHLENQIRSGRHKLRHARLPLVWRTSRRIDQQHVARRSVRVVPVLRIGQRRSRERHAHRRAAQPFRIRRPDVDHPVMHVFRTRWQHLRHLHPFIFGESRRHDFVGVLHRPMRGNRHRDGHRHHVIRLRNAPAAHPMPRRGRIAGVSGRRPCRQPNPRSSGSPRRSARDRSKNVRIADRQTTAAFPWFALPLEFPAISRALARKSRAASDQFRPRDGRSGSAAAKSAAHLCKRPVDKTLGAGCACGRPSGATSAAIAKRALAPTNHVLFEQRIEKVYHAQISTAQMGCVARAFRTGGDFDCGIRNGNSLASPEPGTGAFSSQIGNYSPSSSVHIPRQLRRVGVSS